MKNIITFIWLTIVSTHNLVAQMPSFSWAHAIGGTTNDNGRDVTTDLNGNVFLVGSLDISNPKTFLIKYDAAGNVLWSRNPSSGNAFPSTVSTDGNNNVIVCGTFTSDSTTFGNFTLYRNAIPGPSFADIFTVKYDEAGNVIWANSVGGTSSESGGVSTDAAGNSYVVFNSLSPSVTIGGTTYTNTQASSDDSFLIKYDPAGNTMWAKHFTGPSSSDVSDISTDNSGNTYISGNFCVSCTITIDTLTLTGGSYLLKFDSLGNIVWAKTGTGGFIYALYADDNSNFSITGQYYSDTITHGTQSWINSNPGIVSFGYYIAKFDTSGNAIWIKGDDVNSNLSGYCTTIDNIGNVYTLGSFSSTSIMIGTNTYTNQGTSSDIFIVKYDPAGNIIWSDAFGSNNDDMISGIAVNANDDFFITGYFKGPSITLGGIPISNTGNNTYDAFLGGISVASGIEVTENSNEDEWMAYPNPVNEALTLKTTTSSMQSDYFILDAIGRVALTGKTNGEETRVDVKSLSPGIYILKTRSSLANNTIKLVKE